MILHECRFCYLEINNSSFDGYNKALEYKNRIATACPSNCHFILAVLQVSVTDTVPCDLAVVKSGSAWESMPHVLGSKSSVDLLRHIDSKEAS